jgi:ABC-type cobalamin transport system permease subunit
MELDPTWARAFQVWWAFFWRNVVGAFAAAVGCAGVIGFVGEVAGLLLRLPSKDSALLRLAMGAALGSVLQVGVAVGAMRLVIGSPSLSSDWSF